MAKMQRKSRSGRRPYQNGLHWIGRCSSDSHLGHGDQENTCGNIGMLIDWDYTFSHLPGVGNDTENNGIGGQMQAIPKKALLHISCWGTYPFHLTFGNAVLELTAPFTSQWMDLNEASQAACLEAALDDLFSLNNIDTYYVEELGPLHNIPVMGMTYNTVWRPQFGRNFQIDLSEFAVKLQKAQSEKPTFNVATQGGTFVWLQTKEDLYNQGLGQEIWFDSWLELWYDLQDKNALRSVLK